MGHLARVLVVVCNVFLLLAPGLHQRQTLHLVKGCMSNITTLESDSCWCVAAFVGLAWHQL